MSRRLSSSSRALLFATFALLALGTGSLLWAWFGPPDPRLVHEVPQTPAIGGPFQLTDQHGRARSDADFRGRYMLVQFGYSHCTDVCPVALQTMSLAIDDLAKRDAAAAKRVVPIFITVDPARDTVDALRAYAANFHPRLVALTGSREAIAKVAKAYFVYYGKAAPAAETAAAGGTQTADAGASDHAALGQGNGQGNGQGDGGGDDHGDGHGDDYVVNHSSSIYLMGPDGGYVTRFPYTIEHAALAAAIAERMKG